MNPTHPTSLYRFYNANGALLYIGITNSIPRRFDQHSGDKPWYLEVTTMTVEHHPDRPTALQAEKNAIKAEQPRYNIQHNQAISSMTPRNGAGRWKFTSLQSGYKWQADLVLYPELDCSAMVADFNELDGEGQFEEYVQYLQRHHPEWIEADAVPIIWSVHSSQGGIFEAAPFTEWALKTEQDFLTSFSWPVDAATSEPLDWYQLPVVNDRYPDFAQALAWTPSPLQPTCPLRSLVYSRCGVWKPQAVAT